jgi:protein gp37
MNKTNIGWTDYSVNPLKMELPDGVRLNVCVHKSEGCRHCYAETLVKRWWNKDEYGDFPGYTAALLKLGKPVIVEKELQAVIRLDQQIAKGRLPKDENKVFWNDMTDEYLDYWPDDLIDQCWAVRALTPNLIHQVLTKRADRLHEYFKNRFTRHYAAAKAKPVYREV